MLGLSENLAGVTLLAFGNGSPDIFTSLSNIGRDDTELMFTQLIGGANFVTGFIIGLIMIIRPAAHIPPRTYVRDVLFLLAGVIFISNSSHDQGYTLVEGIITISIYLLFLLTVIIDHFYMKRKIKFIREQSDISIATIEVQEELNNLESIVDFQVRNRRNTSIIIDPARISILPQKLSKSPNENLLGKFFNSLNPINNESWTDGNCIVKTFMILSVSLLIDWDTFFKILTSKSFHHNLISRSHQFTSVYHS
jgi:solute carrier family 24 (sodium/potassium/calcium exchanger), member 6